MFFQPTPTQEKILRSLARYKFLTTSQMLRLGVSTHQPNLSKSMKVLKTRKFVETADFSLTQRIDKKVRTRKAESFYFLTKKGATEVQGRLEVSAEVIKYPTGTKTLFSDKYFHRKYAIDCEIEASIAAKEKGYKVALFDRDFDRTGSNRTAKGVHAKTKIESKEGRHIIPDGNAILSNGDDYKLFTFELHNTRGKKAIINQLIRHADAVENGSLGLKYKIKKLHRVLNVFIEESKMKAVIEGIKSLPEMEQMDKFFFFKTLEEIKTGHFYDKWLNLKGDKIDLLS